MPLDNLRPQKIVLESKPIEKIVKTTKTTFNLIDELEGLAKTSDFQRLIYKAITGKVHRGSKASLQNELRFVIQKIRNI